jgi:ribosomal protein S18 acetylase RimI-like enzyme
MQIIPMSKEHVSSVLAIDAECFGKPVLRKTIEKQIRKAKGGSFWASVAVDGDDVLGYSIAEEVDGDSISIISICVAEFARRKGVGTELVEHLYNGLRDAKCVALTALAEQSRIDAQLFLSNVGFYSRSTTTIGDMTAYRFRRTVPFDDLADLHLVALAAELKHSRLVEVEDEDAFEE